jgi:hypothetical protein
MDPRAQHRANADKEKHWIADAARDAHDMTREKARLAAEGNIVEARFAAEEARNAESWVPKRRAILRREERLS